VERTITVTPDGTAEVGGNHDGNAHPETSLYIAVAAVLAGGVYSVALFTLDVLVG
jgi:hypothetical protein